MGQQVIETPQFGAADRRVIEKFTPKNGVIAPAMQADFLGQVYINTVTGIVYMAIATDSEVASNDWVRVSNA
jgi:hypothetical protein